MSCVNRLEKDLGYNCEHKPIAGTEKNILLINREDIDWAATTITGNVISTLVLKNSKTGFMVSAATDKHFTATSKPVIEESGINGHTHTLGFRIYGVDAETCAQIDSLVDGASLVAIVERKSKGTDNKSAFDVLGLQVGLEVSSDSAGRDYFANDGVYMLNLATPSGQKEPKNVLKWLQTDYATTKTKFDAKLAS